MKFAKIIFLFILLIPFGFGWSQSSFSTGLLPRIRVSTKINDQLKWINGIESRQLILEDVNNSVEYEYILTDVSTMISLKTGVHSVFNSGYLLRIEDTDIIHRSIQQYNIVQELFPIRLGHRFVTDQTFSSKDSPRFRVRYRIAAEKPLTGEKVDPKEFYLKLGNEYLGALQSNEFDLEIRLLPFIGYELNPSNKIELGLDYRLSEFLNSKPRNIIWVSFNWFCSFDLQKKAINNLVP